LPGARAAFTLRHRMKLHRPHLLAAALFALLLTWLIVWRPFSAERPSEQYFLELKAAAPVPASINVKLDEGHGVAFEALADFRSANDPQTLFARLPPGRIRSVQITVFSAPGLAVTGARIRTREGTLLAEIPRTAFKAGEGTTELVRPEATGFGPTEKGARSFTFDLTPKSPIYIPSGNEPWAIEVLAIFFVAAAILYALFARIDHARLAPLQRKGARAVEIARSRPVLTLAVIAIAAGLLASYPVVFFGKSFLSPNHYTTLLYADQPAVPGAPIEPQESPTGADLGAMMWQTQPYSALVSETMLKDHELPLWNRYSSGGISLLAQDLSMAGDPLNLLFLWAKGAVWSWDARFVLAKILFALGIGLCASQVVGRLGPAALVTASAAWIGYYAFRFNHAAIFSLCYAPWVLLPWLAAIRAETRRALWLCALALIVADWAEINSGTGKESSMLLLCMNCAGLLAIAISRYERTRGRNLRVAVMLGASVLFLLISAPVWVLFVDALRHSFTVYDEPKVYQLQPGLALGLFDDLFEQDFSQHGYHTSPSANFLVLSGVLWFFAAARSLRTNRAALALTILGVPVAALVFGLIPPAWVVQWPLIGNIQHIHNTFGCVLIVWLFVLAAAGLHDCREGAGSPEWLPTWRRVAIALGVLMVAYLGFSQALPQPPYNLFTVKAPLHSEFFVRCAPLLLLAAAGLPWALRAWREPRGYRLAGAAALLLCLLVIHFRHGMYVATKFDDFVLNPKTRVDLNGKSAALEQIRGAMREPARGAGFGDAFMPGYNVLTGLETISGAEPLQSKIYRELYRSCGVVNDWGWRLRVDEWNLAANRGFFDLLGIRYFLRTPAPGTKPPDGLTPMGQADLDVFENPTAWPRAFFTDFTGRYRAVDELAVLLPAAHGKPFAAIQSDTSSEPSEYVSRQIMPARDYRLTANTTEFTVSAPSPGLAVLCESFEEGNFRVRINGAPAACERVDHIYKAVKLDRAGEYRIRFEYWPHLLTPSLYAAALGLLLAAIGSAFLLSHQRLSDR
jgi:hypothetical protein